MQKISPKYMMGLIKKVKDKIWTEYQSYKDVETYMARWQDITYENYNNTEYDFYIQYQNNSNNIDLDKTFKHIPDEKIFQIAIDLGLEIPGLIYSVAEIRGLLAEKYQDASRVFENAYKELDKKPDHSILLANSALEKIIKKICSDKSLTKCNEKDSTSSLIDHILKEFDIFPNKELQKDVRKIASSLITIAKTIDDIRSKNTDAHGIKDDYLIDDVIYSQLMINSVSTLGLFLINFYEKKVGKAETTTEVTIEDDVPF